MREIEFRGWNTKVKIMLDLKKITPLALDSKMSTEGLFLPFADDVILMQFTGLLDKNGTKVFEGDIVKISDEGGYQGVIIFSNGKFVCDYHSGWSLPKSDYMEVIGNKWQNPELLEGKS